MTLPTAIDSSAPVVAHDEIDIAAPRDVVWQLHADVDAWPSWNVDITDARLAGPLEVGASFSWTSLGFAVTSTVYELTEGARVLWGGTSDGITRMHEWVVTSTATGAHVEVSMSLSGPPVVVDVAGMQLLLDASVRSWLQQLKRAAETR